jgi:hypothetical protein
LFSRPDYNQLAARYQGDFQSCCTRLVDLGGRLVDLGGATRYLRTNLDDIDARASYERERKMQTSLGVRTHWLMSALVVTLCSAQLPAQTHSSGATNGPQRAGKEADGQHDFDWDIGTWKTHQKRLLHPLTGSTTWVEYHGTDVVRKIWDGANVGEIRADGPAGHLELFTLRLYNPETHEWSVYFTNSTSGALSAPAVGAFKNGRGEFYDQETYNGRTILLRFSVADITANSCRFEQAFSPDGGRTWETNFIVTEALVKDEPKAP